MGLGNHLVRDDRFAGEALFVAGQIDDIDVVTEPPPDSSDLQRSEKGECPIVD